MKRVSQILIFCLLSIFAKTRCLSQELIVDDVALKRGLYASFEEFKTNSPSIQIEFEIDTIQRGIGYINYKLRVKDESVDLDTVWGFCDGSNAYIQGFKTLMGKNSFDKILFIGRYCLFDRFVPGSAGMPTGHGVIGARFSRVDHLLINFNNGKRYYVQKKSVEEIIKQDPELWDKYLKDTKKKSKYNDYIKNYSLKHMDEVKRD